MAFADEQSYEEMIAALQNFLAELEEQCTVMETAGTDCVDNTDNDPAATKSAEKLSNVVSKIRGTFERVEGVISALQEELEEIRVAAQKADKMDE